MPLAFIKVGHFILVNQSGALKKSSWTSIVMFVGLLKMNGISQFPGKCTLEVNFTEVIGPTHIYASFNFNQLSPV